MSSTMHLTAFSPAVSLYCAAKYLLIVEVVDHYVMAHVTGLTKALLLERFHATDSPDRIITEEEMENELELAAEQSKEAKEETSDSEGDETNFVDPQKLRKFDEQVRF